jgi:hypothetical protein
MVYGPQGDQEKVTFLQEIRQIRSGGIGSWLLCGDFNLVYKARNKSNGRLNRCLMGKFHRLLEDLELSELHLHGRLCTWSNEQLHPTLECIDRKFSSLQWSEQFPKHWLWTTSSTCSDHAPLLLHTNTNTTTHKRFMFETICPRFPGYLDVVASSWHCLVGMVDPLRALDIMFGSIAKALKSWSQKMLLD